MLFLAIKTPAIVVVQPPATAPAAPATAATPGLPVTAPAAKPALAPLMPA